MKLRKWWIIFGGDPSDDKEQYKRYVSGLGPMKTFLDEECKEVIELPKDSVVLSRECVEKVQEALRIYMTSGISHATAAHTLIAIEKELQGQEK